MKDGFTLVELLAVIAILAVIVVFAVPNLSGRLSSTKNQLNNVQEKELKDAAKLYIDDMCILPISDETVCPLEISTNSNGFVVASGNLTLSEIVLNGYLSSSEITNNCKGNIMVEENKINVSNINCEF